MNSNLDLQGLAVDRSEPRTGGPNRRRHVFTRYVLPGGLIVGFLLLLGWAARDYVFPPRVVKVVPVYATTAERRQEGEPLFNASGWIEPRPTAVRVAALAPGVVETLLVVEDQPIRAGEPVAELVKADARLDVEKAVADLELQLAQADEAQAALVAAKTRHAKPVHLVAKLGEAEAALAQLKTQLKNLPFETRRAEADQDAAQKDYQAKANSKGVVPKVEIEIASSKLASAKALVDELRNRAISLANEVTAQTGRRDALKTQLELLADEVQAVAKADSQVRSAAARVAQARVAVAQAKLQLDRMTVVAPITGRVFQLIADPGARIGGPAQNPGYDGSTIVTLYRPEMLQIRVDVRFEDIPRVQLNQPVEINNPALASPIVGQVLIISSEADIQQNTLQVKVAIPDPPEVFKPDMLVAATFLAPKQTGRPTTDDKVARIYVLQQLVQQGADGPFVWVVDQSNGVARRVAIQTGSIGANGLREVTKGLNVSSRIIASNADGLVDGERIRVDSNAAPEPATPPENDVTPNSRLPNQEGGA